MYEFIIYDVKVAVTMAAFYLFYKLLLSRETLHTLNRAVLVGTAVLSFILPLCVITLHRTVVLPAGIAAPSLPSAAAIAAGGAFAAAGEPAMLEETAAGLAWWKNVVISIYLAGVAAVLAKVVAGIAGVRRIISGGEMHTDAGGYRIVVTDNDTAPFSWMKWIVLSRADYESGNNHVLCHERAHLDFGHSWDVLLVDMLSAAQWFNPAMWLLRQDLRAIHEYEADNAVLRQGADIKEYQYSLIKKAVSASGYSITNSFNHSILKNRITMMSKTKSRMSAGLKTLYILPLLALVLSCNARTEVRYKSNENPVETEEQAASELVIDIRLDEAGEAWFYVDDKQIAIDDIGALATEICGSGADRRAAVSGDGALKAGCIFDIQEELRKADVLNVRYFCKDVPVVSNPGKMPPHASAEMEGLSDGAFVKENVHQIRINSNDKVLFFAGNDHKIFDGMDPDGLRNAIAEYLLSFDDASGQVFALRCERGVSFAVFVKAQNDIRLAYQQAREVYALKTWAKGTDILEDDETIELLRRFPVNVWQVDAAK